MKSLSIRRYRRSTQDLSASAAPQGVVDGIVAVARHGVQSPHVSEAFIVVSGYLSKDVGYRATDRLRADLVGHCLRLGQWHSRLRPERAQSSGTNRLSAVGSLECCSGGSQLCNHVAHAHGTSSRARCVRMAVSVGQHHSGHGVHVLSLCDHAVLAPYDGATAVRRTADRGGDVTTHR